MLSNHETCDILRSSMSFTKILMVFAGSFLFAGSVFAGTLPSNTYSTIIVDKSSIESNGVDMARVTVTVKDANLNAMPGVTVSLVSSRGSDDDIKSEKTITDSLGKIRFNIRSLKAGVSIYTAHVGETTLAKTARLTFTGVTEANFIALNAGDLIKIPEDGDVKTLSDTAVYLYASDGKRYVFPNENVYFSWYRDFSDVKTISIGQMSQIPIGANVTYHPGYNLVKFQTDPKTYAVTRGGVLRWVKSEAIAKQWFGPDWARKVDDISEAFYVNYTFGEPVNNALDVDPETIYKSTNTIEKDKGIDKRKF